LGVIVGVVALTAAACGSDSNDDDSMTGSATRDVSIDMVDNAFKPATVKVDAGQSVRFVFNNTGAVEHDAFIGDAAAQAAHEEEMNPSDGMSSSSSMSSGDMGSDTTMDSDMGSQDDGDGITVKPGETGELTYTFNKPGTVEIGCHEAGHYASGMKITVTAT